MTPRQQLDRRKSTTSSIGSEGLYDPSGEGEGMGNLADELADVWDEEGGEEPGSSFLEGLREGSVDPSTLHEDMGDRSQMENDASYAARSPATPLRKPDVNNISPTRSAGNVERSPAKQHRRGESRYEGLKPGNPSDPDGYGDISTTLARQMAQVEHLARQGLNDDSVSEAGGVIPRTTIALKDLGAQASIENGVNRIVSAYTSIAGHRTQKPREIFSLAQSLLLDGWPKMSDTEIDIIVAEIDLLIRYLELPTQPNPLESLHFLVASTTDLTHSLRFLSDMLQESRQATSAAWRRLKNARDFVIELHQEEEAREEGIRYVERGDWDQRLRDREAQRVCGDVVAGFETTCDGWRARLFGRTGEATPA